MTFLYSVLGCLCRNNMALILSFKQLEIEKAWDGDFDEFMNHRSNHLVFE